VGRVWAATQTERISIRRSRQRFIFCFRFDSVVEMI
jgi:hypothetical protein